MESVDTSSVADTESSGTSSAIVDMDGSRVRRKRLPNEKNPVFLASLEEDLKKRTAKRRAKVLRKSLETSSPTKSRSAPPISHIDDHILNISPQIQVQSGHINSYSSYSSYFTNSPEKVSSSADVLINDDALMHDALYDADDG